MRTARAVSVSLRLRLGRQHACKSRTARAVVSSTRALNTLLNKGTVRANMPRHVDFSADLILVCNSLASGGIERVVSTLANEWTLRGHKICVVTMHDRRRFYDLD